MRDLCFLAPAKDFTSERVRQGQIDALVRLLPFTSVVTLLNATMVAASLYGAVPTVQLAAWLGVIAGLGVLRVVGSRPRRAALTTH